MIRVPFCQNGTPKRDTTPASWHTAARHDAGTSFATTSTMTDAQKRFIRIATEYGADEDGAEYWPVVNDWVRDAGRAKSLAFRNINQTTNALITAGLIHLDDDGLIHLGRKPTE